MEKIKKHAALQELLNSVTVHPPPRNLTIYVKTTTGSPLRALNCEAGDPALMACNNTLISTLHQSNKTKIQAWVGFNIGKRHIFSHDVQMIALNIPSFSKYFDNSPHDWSVHDKMPEAQRKPNYHSSRTDNNS